MRQSKRSEMSIDKLLLKLHVYMKLFKKL